MATKQKATPKPAAKAKKAVAKKKR